MMSEWISVDERLPEESSALVLVYGPSVARLVRGGIVGYVSTRRSWTNGKPLVLSAGRFVFER